MKRHLYELKTPCPAVHSMIELTEEIKQCILADRIYSVAPAVAPAVALLQSQEERAINQFIKHHNEIQKYVVNIDMQTKLKQLHEHKNTELQVFKDTVESRYAPHIRHLTNQDNRKEPITFRQEDFLDMVHNITRTREQNLEDLNSYFNKNENSIFFYVGSWESNQVEKGMEYLIDTLVSNYLDFYEVYLIRRLETCRASEKATLMNSLQEYYRFCSTFNVKPYVRSRNDSQILYNEDDDRGADIDGHRLVDMYEAIYERCKEGVSPVQRRATHRLVLDVIKSSTKTNVKDLNIQISRVLRRDMTEA